MRNLWRLGLMLALLICTLAQAPAQAQGSVSSSIESSLVLLQSDVGGEVVTGTAFVIKSGDMSLALTSYEAVKGASKINAIVPGQGTVMAHLLKFAPEANIALLEIAAPNVPAVKLGDYEMLRNKPLVLCSTEPKFDGAEAVAFSTLEHPCSLQSVISRPTGTILRVVFSPGISDETSGAPVVNPTTGEVVAIALSLNVSQVDTLRFSVPAIEASALCPEVITNTTTAVHIKVLDGSEAPVKAGAATEAQEGSNLWMYIAIGAVCAVILGVVGFKMRKGKNKVAPFSFLPALPEGQDSAFVTADGKLLPIDAEIIKVGRAPDNTWVFQDKTVSNYHARIKKNKTTGRYEVEDLRSSNGTFVGKRRIVSAESVTPGTIVRFGKTIQVMFMLRTMSTEKPAPAMDFKINKIN